jgi:hypothetical protein
MGRPWLRMTMRFDEIGSSIVVALLREMYDAQQRAGLVR